MTALELAQLRTVPSGLDHPEGSVLAPDGMLYAGGKAGQVYHIDPSYGSHEQIAETDGYALGVCLDARGSVYVCDAGKGAVALPSRPGIGVELNRDALARFEQVGAGASGV
jgi:sugar lactone lactonase YvrE